MGVSARMKGLIDKVITFYEMRANALGVLVANTQKAIEELAPDRERMDSKQEEKLNNFVEDLTGDVANTLTRFWFQKEHKLRNNEQMSDDEVRNLADFANFVKTLTKDLRSLPTRFQEGPGQTFEQEFDKEVKQMEGYVQNRLKEFDEALTGTNNAWKKRVGKSVSNVLGRIRKSLKGRLFSGALNINVANSNGEKQKREIYSKRVG
jgi:hypothetical protein